MNIHLVLYSNREPYTTTKKLTIDTVNQYSKNNIIVHDFDLEKIQQLDWFEKIKNLPQIYTDGRRDGYHNAWKAFVTKEVYDKINEGDILYYVDSSQHFKIGFTQNIDRLCELAYKIGFIAGSVGNNVRNNSYNCCDNIAVWNKILPMNNNYELMNTMHVLDSWFILKKDSANDSFIYDWAYYTSYSDNELTNPLVTYHHTADQSIFNILVHKYKCTVFYKPDIYHDDNKNKNRVLEVLNTHEDIDHFFIKL